MNQKSINASVSEPQSIASKIKKAKQDSIVNTLNEDIDFFKRHYGHDFIDSMPNNENIDIQLLPQIKLDNNSQPLDNPELYFWKQDMGASYSEIDCLDTNSLNENELSHRILLSTSMLSNHKIFNQMVQNSENREQAQSFVFFHEMGHLIDQVACSYTKKHDNGENTPFKTNLSTQSKKLQHFILEDSTLLIQDGKLMDFNDADSHIFCKAHIKENVADCWSALLTYEKFNQDNSNYSIKDAVNSIQKARQKTANNNNITYRTIDALDYLTNNFDEQKQYSFQDKLDLIQESSEKGLVDTIEKIIQQKYSYKDKELAESLYISLNKENIAIKSKTNSNSNNSVADKVKEVREQQEQDLTIKQRHSHSNSINF